MWSALHHIFLPTPAVDCQIWKFFIVNFAGPALRIQMVGEFLLKPRLGSSLIGPKDNQQ
jgi:hypothetical protein